MKRSTHHTQVFSEGHSLALAAATADKDSRKLATHALRRRNNHACLCPRTSTSPIIFEYSSNQRRFRPLQGAHNVTRGLWRQSRSYDSLPCAGHMDRKD